jgi:hypothetical protein
MKKRVVNAIRETAALVACAPLVLWLALLLALAHIGHRARITLLRWLLPPLEEIREGSECEVVVIYPPRLPAPAPCPRLPD